MPASVDVHAAPEIARDGAQRGFAVRHEALLFPIAAFIATRLALLVFAWCSLRLLPVAPNFLPESRAHPVLAAFCHFDCGHYYQISSRGYSIPDETKWFPLFPLLGALVRICSGLSPFYALLLVANLMALGAYICIYQLFSALSDRSSARAGLLLFAAYPFAFFHSSIYAESTAIFFTALTLWLAEQKRWWLSSIGLGLAMLARHISAVAAASVLAFHIAERGTSPKKLLWNRAMPSFALVALIFSSFLIYCHVRFGDALVFVAQRRDVNSMGVGPYWLERNWWSAAHAFYSEQLANEPWLAMYVVISLWPAAGLIGLAMRREWRALLPAGALLLAVYWSIGVAGLGRYSASLWPGYLALGAFCAKRPSLNFILLFSCALLQGLFFHLWIHGFSIF